MYVGKMDMKITTHWKIASRFTAPTLRCRCLSVCVYVCMHTYICIYNFFFSLCPNAMLIYARILKWEGSQIKTQRKLLDFFFPLFFLTSVCACVLCARLLARFVSRSYALTVYSVLCVCVCVCVVAAAAAAADVVCVPILIFFNFFSFAFVCTFLKWHRLYFFYIINWNCFLCTAGLVERLVCVCMCVCKRKI